jgi:hypothetical protein
MAQRLHYLGCDRRIQPSRRRRKTFLIPKGIPATENVRARGFVADGKATVISERRTFLFSPDEHADGEISATYPCGIDAEARRR